jgi:hypothetical protein
MPDPGFATEILATEVVVNHLEDGHIFRFPIMPNGTVSLNGSRIEPNPKAPREARRYLFDAHDAARFAFDRLPVSGDAKPDSARHDGARPDSARPTRTNR